MRKVLLILLCFTVTLSGCIATARRAKREIERHAARQKSLDVSPVEWEVRPGHARLMMSAADWTNAKRRALSDPRMAILTTRADTATGQPLLTDGPGRLLTRSREALQRIPLYAALWRLTGDKKYARAGTTELLNVCNFPDWEPADPLSTCEMMMSVAIGYDWLYDALTDTERERVVDAIVEKGLHPSLDGYGSGGGWTTAPHNWNLVCNGAVIVGSLAILEEEPEIARRTLALAMKSITHGLATYDACAGGWPEGPMYHNYATRYAIFAAAALESALLQPVALPSKHLKDAGNFRIAMTGPTGKSFNFGDSSEIVGNSPWMMWLGARYNPAFSDFQREQSQRDPSPFDLLWDDGKSLPAAQRSVSAFFGAAQVTSMSAMGDRQTYVAVKAGDNGFSHSHLDIGTFVIDMMGQRWASDLGPDNYDLPGYLHARRDEYLRSSTPGHNTLVIGDKSQPGAAKGIILRTDGKARTIQLDLTGAYPSARNVFRNIAVADDAVVIKDGIELDSPEPIVWHMHTQAQSLRRADGIVLTQNGKSVLLSVKSAPDARIEIVEDTTRPPALPIENMRDIRLIIPPTDRASIEAKLSKLP